MLFKISLLAALALEGVVTECAKTPKPEPFGYFTENVIYQPTTGQSISYPRFAELEDGTLLVTAAFGGFHPPFFPVFKSTDGGAKWKWISNITDQVNGFGLGAQPAIMELTQEMGGFAKGTILAAGNSEGSNANGTGFRIDLYASKNQGKKWEFVSHIAESNTTGPIWEPYLMVYNNQLVCYYSDSRNPAHSQQLSHQTSFDLINWGAVVPDVQYYNETYRPGMTIVQYVKPVDKWFLVHEFPGGLSLDHAGYPVYYRMAESPLEFNTGEANLIAPKNIGVAQQPSSSPYITWTPHGGDQGTIFVSDADHSSIYYNQAGGDVNSWMNVDTPQTYAYSRAVHAFAKYPDHLMIIGGGNWPGVDPPGTLRPLSVSVVDINKLLKGKYPPGGPDPVE